MFSQFELFSDDFTLANDICLLQLSEPVDLSEDDANVICLPSKYEKYDDDNCVIAGWGLEGKKIVICLPSK